jgi:hypothetical protein
MKDSTKTKIFFIIGILLIGSAFYFRMDSIMPEHTLRDEMINFISAVKLNTPHPEYDPKLYNYEHPFLGKKIMGIFIEQKEYPNVTATPANMYVYNYASALEIKNQEWIMRLTLALFGILAIIPAFLVGKELYGNLAGIFTAAFYGTGAGFLAISRIAYQDAFLYFFMFFGIYFIIRFVKEENEKWENVYLLTTVIFTLLSALVRLGQPIALVGMLFIALFIKRKKILWIKGIILLLIAYILLFLSYSTSAYRALELLRAESQNILFTSSAYTGLFSMTSYLFLFLAVFWVMKVLMNVKKKKPERITLEEAKTRFGIEKTKDAKEYIQTNYSAKKIEKEIYEISPLQENFFGMLKKKYASMKNEQKLMLYSMLIFAILFTFTEAGLEPRYYIVFFLPILAFVASKIKMVQGNFFVCAIILVAGFDVANLFTNHPNYLNYTIIGKTALIKESGYDSFHALNEVYAFLKTQKNPVILTNEPAILLRYENATPYPPTSNRYKEHKNCTKEFFDSKKNMFFVYYGDKIEENPYLCYDKTKMKFETEKIIYQDEKPMYTIYKIG